MGGTIKKIVKNPIKFVKTAVSGVGKNDFGGAYVQAQVAEKKKAVKPLSAKRGSAVGEMASPVAKAARRRGRSSNVMTSGQGVTGSTETRKKTLLGG